MMILFHVDTVLRRLYFTSTLFDDDSISSRHCFTSTLFYVESILRRLYLMTTIFDNDSF